eukprot:TRINITY_DN89414_c0_g1_i1.p1 TRINITY_DN89414_c0_g1~~TRINITY_DN89414_c0_g1_i1.p1  ORF type:complete len:631 (-),score=126.60 TRINITY_DN89414_c0_g1_i1:135-2006(-)
MAFSAGAAVVLRADSSGKPALALVAAGPLEDGRYRLASGLKVKAWELAALPAGANVEYYSASMNQWISGHFARPGQVTGTLDLDVKEGAELQRVRLPEAEAAGYASGGASAKVPGTNFTPSPPGGTGRLRGWNNSSADEGYSGPLAGSLVQSSTARPKARADSQRYAGAEQLLRPGDLCFYKSSTHGWIHASVQQYYADRDCYDLDVKQGVGIQSVFPLQEGADVEYHSASTNSWIPAKVLRARPAEASLDLDVKEQAPFMRVRPRASMAPPATMGPPATMAATGASAGQPLPSRLSQLRSKLDKKDATEMRQRLESVSQLNRLPGVGEGRDPVSFAMAELRNAFRSRDPAVLEDAIEKAAQAGVPEEELENAAQALKDLEEPMWRYEPEDRNHLDIRSVPEIGGQRTSEALLAGEVFRVSQEKVGRDGINYLRLADGRGWVFEKKEGVGTLCLRYELVRFTVISSTPNRPLGLSFMEIPGKRFAVSATERGGWAEQQGVRMGDEVIVVGSTRVGPKMGLAELIQVAQGRGPCPLAMTLACQPDNPGKYVVTNEGAAVTPNVNIGSEKDIIGMLQAGTQVEVKAVVNNVGDQRVRGQIVQPFQGWISLLNTGNGKRWARRQGR